MKLKELEHKRIKIYCLNPDHTINKYNGRIKKYTDDLIFFVDKYNKEIVIPVSSVMRFEILGGDSNEP